MYKLFYEYTIFASYVGISNINNEAVRVLNNCQNQSITNNLFANMKFYKDILKPNRVVNLDNKTNILVNDENISFTSSSSCLLPNKKTNGYLLNIRYVNYHITEAGKYLNCKENIITANQFVELSSDFTRINEKYFDIVYSDSLYLGVEDIRIFNDIETNKILCIGTGLHSDNTIGIMDGEYDIDKNYLAGNELKQTFESSRCEKNWVYVEYEKSLHII